MTGLALPVPHISLLDFYHEKFPFIQVVTIYPPTRPTSSSLNLGAAGTEHVPACLPIRRPRES